MLAGDHLKGRAAGAVVAGRRPSQRKSGGGCGCWQATISRKGRRGLWLLAGDHLNERAAGAVVAGRRPSQGKGGGGCGCWQATISTKERRGLWLLAGDHLKERAAGAVVAGRRPSQGKSSGGCGCWQAAISREGRRGLWLLAGDHLKGLPAPSSFCFVLGCSSSRGKGGGNVRQRETWRLERACNRCVRWVKLWFNIQKRSMTLTVNV